MTDDQGPEPAPTGEPFRLNRRTILIGGTAVAVVAAGRQRAERVLGRAVASHAAPVADLSQGADVYFPVVREEDALVLGFRLYNMHLVKPLAAEPYLAAIDTSSPSYLVVDFPVQAIGEAAPTLTAPLSSTTYDGPTADDPGVGHWTKSVTGGQPTRLAFLIPSGVHVRPSLQSTDTTPGLLAWTHFTPALCGGITSSPSTYAGPGKFETSIGAPFGLALSPEPEGRWLHSEQPIAKDGRTELWQTRLGGYTPPVGPLGLSELAEFPTLTPQARAVYSDGFKRTVDPDTLGDDASAPLYPVDLPLTVADRAEIVMLSSDHTLSNYTPAPLDARRLMLSSGGAWLDLHGAWSGHEAARPGPPFEPGLSLTSWTHVATHGRDEHVVATFAGYLLPFGHGAVLVEQTQRRFEASPTGYPVANLRTRRYVVIRRQEHLFGPGSHNPFLADEGRGFPFRRVRLNTRVTPNLTLPRLANPDPAYSHAYLRGAGFCYAQGVPFQFSVSAWDWEGRKIDFSIPMLFVSATAAVTEAPTSDPTIASDSLVDGAETGSMTELRHAYGMSAPNLRTGHLNSAKVAMAPSLVSGDTTVKVDTMTFTVVGPVAAANGATFDEQFADADLPRSNPAMDFAAARIPSVQSVSPGATSKVSYDGDYVADDFGSGAAVDSGSVFLQVGGQALDFGSTGSSGTSHPGVATPNMAVGGISRTRGVIGGTTGVQKFKTPNAPAFSPSDFFKAAKLLGGLDLASIIVDDLISASPIPEFKTVQVYPDGADGEPDTDQTPLGIRTSLDWSPSIQPDSASNPIFQPDDGASFTLQAKAEARYDGSAPTSEVTGSLKYFTLNMFGGDPFLKLQFNEFSFHARNGAKPTVTPDIQQVTFGGALSFVNDLESLLSSGDGNGITVTPTQVSAQYTLAIPSVGIGVFNLTNLSFTAGIDIPFIDKPARVRFSFCTRDKPFLISVMIFGGGGFVGLALGSDGMELLEISLEFGAHIGIDVGVASGSIEIMAGIYFAVGKNSDPSKPGEMVQLTGFVKAHGELNFGPVGVALTFMLSLNYKKDNNESICWGCVQVHLEVHVFMFSGNVDFTAQKQFGGGHDPNFGDTLTSQDFSDYALAFA